MTAARTEGFDTTAVTRSLLGWGVLLLWVAVVVGYAWISAVSLRRYRTATPTDAPLWWCEDVIARPVHVRTP